MGWAAAAAKSGSVVAAASNAALTALIWARATSRRAKVSEGGGMWRYDEITHLGSYDLV